MSSHFKLLTEDLYDAYLLKCRLSNISTLFLPGKYFSDLWGIIAVNDDQIKGGWVGKLRGNKPIARYLIKGVWFDSLPVIFEDNDPFLFDNMLDYAKKLARKNGIVTFNVTHWSRQQLFDKDIFDEEENNATFILDLKKDKDSLWKEMDKQLRQKIIKGEKNEIEVIVKQKDEAVTYLDIFQKLRQETQKRAINKNSNASMLLKSNRFFEDILLNSNSHLFIAKYNNEAVSVLITILNGKTIYCFSSGSNMEANKEMGASSFLFWKAIEFAKDSDVEIFDLGGVPVNPESNHPAYGVYYFKKSFGGEYKEFSSGKIIIRKKMYPILNFILKNRILLRFLSRIE